MAHVLGNPKLAGTPWHEGPPTRCPRCAYSLAGLPAEHRCPECGYDYDPYATVIISPKIDVAQRRIGAGLIVLCLVVIGGSSTRGRGADYLALFALANVLYGIYRIIRERGQPNIRLLVNRTGIEIHRKGTFERLIPWDTIRHARFGFLTGRVNLYDGEGRRVTSITAKTFDKRRKARECAHAINALARHYINDGIAT